MQTYTRRHRESLKKEISLNKFKVCRAVLRAVHGVASSRSYIGEGVGPQPQPAAAVRAAQATTAYPVSRLSPHLLHLAAAPHPAWAAAAECSGCVG